MLNKSSSILNMSSSGQKSSFAQTCNLLSQYLKEKGKFGDISLGISTPKPEANQGVEATRTTMNLLPRLENVSGSSSNVIKAADFFPEMACFGSSNPTEDIRKPEPGNSQMTIFYAGKVIVFNDFPAEKAKEIMAFASKATGSSNINNSSTGFVAASGVERVHSSSRAVTPDLNIASTSSGSNSIAPQERLIHQLQPSQAVASDFPIKRRASLHRFFEKRKDRVVARAPYQVNGSSLAPPKPEEKSNSWLEMQAVQSSKQLLDLKL